MTNQALRDAMVAAKMTDEDLASVCAVDVKTVSRWKTEPGRVPHPRHRWAASDALGADESVLWPDAMKQAIKTGPDREIVAVYPRRASCPTSVWRKLITNAERGLTFAGYTNYFLWIEHPNLAGALTRKARAGVRVRFLVGDPDSEVTRNRETVEDVPLTVGTRIRSTLAELDRVTEDVEIAISEAHIAMSVFVFDDDMLVTPHLASSVGHDSPMLHIRRVSDDGLYDRFSSHVKELWANARPQ